MALCDMQIEKLADKLFNYLKLARSDISYKTCHTFYMRIGTIENPL